MSRTPVTLTITITASPAGHYNATVAAWAVPDVGAYGSVWTRHLELAATTRESAPSEVLGALCDALVEKLAT